MKRFHLTSRVTGTATGVQSETLLPSGTSGSVYAWLVREDTGGEATLLTPCLADGLRELSTREMPPAEFRIAAEDEVELTASATVESFRTAFVNPMPFRDGLRFVGEVTATGGYALIVSVWGERE